MAGKGSHTASNRWLASVEQTEGGLRRGGLSSNGLEIGMFLPSNGVSYASVLRLPASSLAGCNSATASKGKVPSGEGDNGCCLVGSGGSSDECTKVKKVEGVLWAVRAQLSRVLEEVNVLIIKVDLGLSMVMGLGSEPTEKVGPMRMDVFVRATSSGPI